MSAHLTADIDLNPGNVFDSRDDYSGDTPSEWTSIGNSSDNAFTGTFEGNGYTIKGLYSTTGGLFGYPGDATIQHLKIENSTVKANDNSGLFANESSGTDLKIENCSVAGYVEGFSAGGFIGKRAYATFADCKTSARVSCSGYAGGYIGQVYVGYSFVRCSNKGNVNSNNSDAGGFIGNASGTSADNSFIDCCTSASVSGYDISGRFIGSAYSDFSIKNCYKTGYIESNNSMYNKPYDGADLVWGQTIGTDSYPVLGGKTVYYGTNCAGTNLYSNETVSSEHNFISLNGKCTVCGVYEDEMSALYGHSITLDGKVGLNYFMEIDDDYANENTTMNFSVINYDFETGQLNELYSQSLPLTDDTKVIYDGKTYYKFTCNLAAKEMTCGVKAQLVNGDKEGTAFYYNVAEYAYTLLNDESYDTKTKELVISMLNYGANSQKYFDFYTEYLANCDLPGELTQLEDTRADELSAYKSSYTPDESYTGSASYYGSSLELKPNTEIKHYFAYDSSKTGIDNFTCTDSEDNSYEIAESGSYLYVKVDNISAHKLGEALTLSLYENGEKVGEISYSPLSYAYSVLSAYPTDDGTHDNARNLVKSLYQYYNKAVEYTTA